MIPTKEEIDYAAQLHASGPTTGEYQAAKRNFIDGVQWLKQKLQQDNVIRSLPPTEDDIWDDVQAIIEYTHDVDAIMQELKKQFTVGRQ